MGTSFLTVDVFYPSNMDPDVLEAYVFETVDNTSAKVLQQFMQAVQVRGWRAFDHHDPEHAPFRYGQHAHDLELPVLFLSAQFDKLAHRQGIRQYGYEAVSSPDASLLDIQGYGHVDLATGIHVFEDVWTPIEDWISTRSR